MTFVVQHHLESLKNSFKERIFKERNLIGAAFFTLNIFEVNHVGL